VRVKKAVGVLLVSIRLTIGALLVYSAVHALGNPVIFAEAVNNYRLLPLQIVNLVAIVLPWLELLVGASLLSGFALDAGSLLAGTMFAAFAFSMLSARLRGLDISCGCFLPLGKESAITAVQILERFLLLTATVLLGILSPRSGWPFRILWRRLPHIKGGRAEDQGS
jgi:putative oxidoreductase